MEKLKDALDWVVEHCDGMAIQKELMAFISLAVEKGWNTDGETTRTNFCFYDLKTRRAWESWQAAKAQVPEGFVLVPKEPTQKQIYHCNRMKWEKGVGRSHIFEDVFVYKAMIEAVQGEGHE